MGYNPRDIPAGFFHFPLKYLYFSRSSNRIDLYFALFPLVMLQEAIFNENLTNDNRYECLEKGLCFVIIYSICLEHYFMQKEKVKDKNSIFIQKMKKSKNCVGITIMDKQTCIKYITLVSSLLTQVYHKVETSMGALGTHYTEHFFAKLRRISHGDNKSDTFLWSIVSDLLFEELCASKNINNRIPKRSSSSGALLIPQKIYQTHPFSESLLSILKLFNKFMQFDYYAKFFPFTLNNDDYTFFEDNFSNHAPPKNFISTRKTCMVATGGLNHIKNFESHSQITGIVNYPSSST